MQNKQEAIRLWGEFSNVPVNKDDELEVDFYGFNAGTDRFDVWSWFEEKFNCSIATDLHIT